MSLLPGLPDPLSIVSNPVGALLDPIGTLTGNSKPPAPSSDDIQ